MVVPKPTPCPSPVSPSQTLKVSLFGATGLRGLPLWSGQYEKVLANQDVYLAEFAAGGGGAVVHFRRLDHVPWRNMPDLQAHLDTRRWPC